LNRSEITARSYNAAEWKLTTVEGKPFPEGELPFDLVMRDGKPVYEVELAIERPDGKRVILSVNAAPIRDVKGTITSVTASFTDTTKRKLTELALQESEQ
jgi:PAS domain-containing protein